MRAGIRLLKDNLCLRGKGFPEDSTNTRGRRYSDAGTHGLRPHAMHRWLCGTFGIYMSPRLGRHASRTACVYSLRMWAIVDAKGMADEVEACDVVDAVDVSYATLDVWASRVRCRMRSDCVVTRGRRLTGIRYGDSGPHGWASSGEISVSLPPRQRRSARPVTSGIRANQFKHGSRSLPVMGSGLAKLVEEPNVTVDDRWNQVVTVDGNPSWCWILWKGEGGGSTCDEVMLLV
ncbi:unnamed protein product [Prunus brigantina]